MRKIIEQCPSCGGDLVITEVVCAACATQVRSQYQPCAFCRLTPEQLAFARLFIVRRGNLREMEKTLGVSYPTVRGKLDEIAACLADAAAVPPAVPPAAATGGPTDPRREVLQLIAAGQLSVREGLARLRGQTEVPAPAPDTEPG
jgi:hypothetical protein